MISAILASFNEADNPIFWDNIDLLKRHGQLLIVDGGSRDGTLERFRGLGVCVHILTGSTRAARYNHGMEHALGSRLLLVHPRTRLNEDCLREVASSTAEWGAFTHAFDHDHPLLRFTSWYSNQVRGGIRSVFYLDHCIFLNRELHVRFRDVGIFEDTYFCGDLRRKSRGVRLKAKAVTSAVRFRKNGVYRQAALNQLLKLLFHLGVSERWMSRIYEKGLSLNAKA